MSIHVAIPTVVPTHPVVAELDRLGDEIAELSAHLDAATARLLALIREFDARGGWNRGFRSCAEWLAWRVGLEPGAARERVRVARALGTLPQLAEALARGQVSYSKAAVLLEETAHLDPGTIAAVEERVLAGVAEVTPGQLRYRVKKAVVAIDADEVADEVAIDLQPIPQSHDPYALLRKRRDKRLPSLLRLRFAAREIFQHVLNRLDAVGSIRPYDAGRTALQPTGDVQSFNLGTLVFHSPLLIRDDALAQVNAITGNSNHPFHQVFVFLRWR